MSQDRVDDRSRLAELGLLTASLSHELRQPLFAIKSIGQMLEKQLNGQSAPLTAELLRQVSYLERLVEGVGTYSRRSADEATPVDTGAIMESACELLRHRGRRHSVSLDVKRDSAVPAARADAVALLQVLVNVVNNAIDASPSGTCIEISHRLVDGRVVVDVADQGPGLDAELRAQVFEAFYTTKGPGKGTGLGLALSRELLQAYEGDLRFVDCDQGACVRVDLAAW
jgi:signal transduction histidine kinase